MGAPQLELIILLLIAVLALTGLARKLVIPYPILLVVGGLGLAVLPGLPTVRLEPELVFFVFLPPILWSAAYFTSLRDFRANIRPIGLLALGLVLATTGAVAWVGHSLLPGLGWPAAVALGAIVSPPDAVAATAIGRRLQMPRRIITILEGESLVNDASALVLYRSAVAVVVGGSFHLSTALGEFALAAGLGVAIGLLVGWVTHRALRLSNETFSDIAITLLAPYTAWLIAERAHASAVLACVAGGFYVRQRFSDFIAPVTRLQARAVWSLLIFILNGLIFILIGLQLAALRGSLPDDQLGRIVLVGLAVSAVAIAVRLVWVPLATYIPRWVSSSLRRRDPVPPRTWIFLVSWTGMRGIVSLAAALALPQTTDGSAPFPFRSEIILVTFIVILTTLVLQGLSLSPLIRAFGLHDDDSLEREELLARERASTAALRRLEEIAREDWPVGSHVERLRILYGQRLRRVSQLTASDQASAFAERAAFRRLRHQTLDAERRVVIELRNEGTVSDEVLHTLEQELDVEALRLGMADTREADSMSGASSSTASAVSPPMA